MDVKEIIRNFIGRFIKRGNVGDDDNLFEQSGINSLFAMQLILFLEKEFDVTLDDDELNLERISSVNAIANLVESKKNS